MSYDDAEVEYMYYANEEIKSHYDLDQEEGAMSYTDLFDMLYDSEKMWYMGELKVIYDEYSYENYYDYDYQDASYSYRYEAEWTYGDVLITYFYAGYYSNEWEYKHEENSEEMSYTYKYGLTMYYGDAFIEYFFYYT